MLSHCGEANFFRILDDPTNTVCNHILVTDDALPESNIAHKQGGHLRTTLGLEDDFHFWVLSLHRMPGSFGAKWMVRGGSGGCEPKSALWKMLLYKCILFENIIQK